MVIAIISGENRWVVEVEGEQDSSLIFAGPSGEEDAWRSALGLADMYRRMDRNVRVHSRHV